MRTISGFSSRGLHDVARNSHNQQDGSKSELTATQELRALMSQTSAVLKEVFQRPKPKDPSKPSVGTSDTDGIATNEVAGQDSKRATMLRVLKLVAPERRLLGLAVR